MELLEKRNRDTKGGGEGEGGGWRAKVLPTRTFFLGCCPTIICGMQKWKLSWDTYELHTRFLHVLAPTCNAQSVIIKQNFRVGAQEEVY